MSDATTASSACVASARLAVADLLAERAPTLARCRLLAIDGPAGSGKTTLARDLATRLRGQGLVVDVLHMDDLYDGWTGLNASLEPRVVGQLLGPLNRGDPARWQRYDWYQGAFAEWHDLPAPDVLVLEGCGSGARSYAPYTTVLVWVEAERATRIRRAVERDGDGVLDEWMPWMALEADYFAANATRSRADVVCSTDE